MMMFLDLFPVGLYQLALVFTHGFWYARSNEVVLGPVWQTLTYFRTIGGTLFLFGGVLPLVYFVLSRARDLVREVEVEEGEWSIYGTKAWATLEEEQIRVAEGK